MKRKSRMQWFGLCLSCAILLSACGQKSVESGGESSRTSTVSPTPTATPSPTVSPTPAVMEEIGLDEVHFPDEAFRQYLYLYTDTNRDRILSAKECEAVTRIRNAHWDHDKNEVWNDGNWDTIHEGEEEEFDYASKITDLRGIEYFPNLYEIQLKGITLSENLAELSLSNPKLGIIDLSFEGTIKHIDLTACESLRYCEIRANTNKHEPESVALDLAGLNRIVELYLNDNIKTTTEVVLATPTPSPIPALPCADHAMNWKDEKLEEAMRSATDIYEREIMLSDVYDIVSLYLWGNEIEDISALAELKNLEELKIGNNKISDVSVLAELPNLRLLEMPENEVTDISALKTSVNLERIDAKDNQIADISVLAGLPKLRWIAMENNCIHDISCLKGLETLECLRLSHNQITDISALSGFPKLSDVWLENNQITSVTDLTELPELSVLLLNHNQITTVRLSELQKLWAFDLQDNQICDISLSDLPELGMLELDNNCIVDVSGLTSLKDLYSLGLTGNPVENIELLDFIPDLNY